jgi:hypothetical protein
MFGDVFTRRLLGAVACGLLAIGTSMAEAGQESSPVAQGHVHPAPPEDGVPQAHEHPAAEPAVFAAREASGTAWQPDETPMRGFHYRAGNWEVMLHGNGFLQVLHESAPEHRGATQAGSINWAGHGRAIGWRRASRRQDDDERRAADDSRMRLSEPASDG